MLAEFLRQAREDRPVYITDVRRAFQSGGTRPFHIHVRLYDGTVRQFPLRLPETRTPEEAEFVRSYVHAMLYNILSSLGALRIDLYLDPSDRECAEMAQALDTVFQTDLPKASRTGFGKCLNVNERTVFALTQGRESFSFRACDIAGEPQVSEPETLACSEPVFSALPAMTRGRLLLGIDIGGTDIKLAVSFDGELALCKEFDWFPASFATAEELIDPILLLTRLLRAAGTLYAQGKKKQIDAAALSKTATLTEMARGAAAMEQAAAGADVSRGFFAHTLGTELGTGWVRPDGSIPEIPLEVYNFIIDLGSFPQKQYDANDVRSINNFNTLLPGTLQKYTCQSGVFRHAARDLPEQDAAVYAEALEKGLFLPQGSRLIVPTEPKDMRKPCLEYFMAMAADPAHPACAEIFRRIGEYLAVTWSETQYILLPETPDRTLFGRLVKNPVCFDLMCQGAARREPELRQYAADGSLANTALMRQLDSHPDYTVAQFAQAVGAIFYGCMGLL